MTSYHQKEELEKLPPGNYCYYCLQPNPRKIIGHTQIVYECLNCHKVDGLKIKIDPGLKSDWHNNELQHFTVGALLKNKKTGKYLLMKKRTYPIVIDVIAGHIQANENPEGALIREVLEESGLKIENPKLLWEGMVENNLCRHGAPNHYWYIFLGSFSGVPRPHIQETSYFQEYTWDEILSEKMLNPSYAQIFIDLDTALLVSV